MDGIVAGRDKDDDDKVPLEPDRHDAEVSSDAPVEEPKVPFMLFESGESVRILSPSLSTSIVPSKSASTLYFALVQRISPNSEIFK